MLLATAAWQAFRCVFFSSSSGSWKHFLNRSEQMTTLSDLRININEWQERWNQNSISCSLSTRLANWLTNVSKVWLASLPLLKEEEEREADPLLCLSCQFFLPHPCLWNTFVTGTPFSKPCPLSSTNQITAPRNDEASGHTRSILWA